MLMGRGYARFPELLSAGEKSASLVSHLGLAQVAEPQKAAGLCAPVILGSTF